MLPNAKDAEINVDKLEKYLLSALHPVGRSKAQFFEALGFGPQAVEALRQGLLEIAKTGKVIDRVRSRFGDKYVIDGAIEGPGRRAYLRTVWLMEKGKPRFITAYPAGEQVDK